LIQTRSHVRNAIASRERQVVMRKVKSTINANVKKKLREGRINLIVQLLKHYWRSKHEAGQSMCVAMNVFFHYRKLMNFAMLSEICL